MRRRVSCGFWRRCKLDTNDALPALAAHRRRVLAAPPHHNCHPERGQRLRRDLMSRDREEPVGCDRLGCVDSGFVGVEAVDCASIFLPNRS
jgi:hypothetical protein